MRTNSKAFPYAEEGTGFSNIIYVNFDGFTPNDVYTAGTELQ